MFFSHCVSLPYDEQLVIYVLERTTEVKLWVY